MRIQIPILWALVLGTRVYATMPVVDYAHISQDAANEVVNLAKYVATASKQTETALNTLQTYENTLLQLTRMGTSRRCGIFPLSTRLGSLRAPVSSY
jgi:hypothetical protein